MLKSLLLIIILLLCSYNLFSQRLCEESFQTRGLFKTNDPNIIIIENQTGLFWYDAETCEFIDTMDFGKYNSVQTRITQNGKYCLILLTTEYTNFKVTKFDLDQKTEIGTYTFEFENSDNYLSNFHLRDNGNELIVLSADDKRLIEYDLETKEEIRFVPTTSPGLSQLKVSPNGNLLGITTSPFSEFNKVLHIYNAHTLELIRSINFRDYFEEDDIQSSSGFEFDPVSNDIYLGCISKIIKYNFESKQTIPVLEQLGINSSSMQLNDYGSKFYVNFWVDAVRYIGEVRTSGFNEFDLLPGAGYYFTTHDNFIIAANNNPRNNIAKISTITDIEESEEIQLSIFPNPSTGNINVSFENPYPQQIQLKLYNIQGEPVKELFNGFYSEALFSNSFDISNNPNGSYLLEIKIGEEEFVENIILEK